MSATRQGILTRATNVLIKTLNEYEPEISNISRHLSEDENDRDQIEERLEFIKGEIKSKIERVDDAIEKYITATDNERSQLSVNEQENLQRCIDANLEKTEEQIGKADQVMRRISSLLNNLEKRKCHDRNDVTVKQTAPPVVNLPPMPIPKFSGKTWEWEAFWGAFNYSVHSQEIDDFLKMNYLLDALEGDAKELAKHYLVSEESYAIVVAHLKEKYGDKQEVVDELLHRMQTAQAASSQLKEQEKLCELLHSVIIQLRHHGECVDSRFFQQQLLRKFTENIQRYVLQQISRNAEIGTPKTEQMLSCIKQFIKQELQIDNRIGKNLESPILKQHKSGNNISLRQNQSFVQGMQQCIYCRKSDHRSVDCNDVVTYDERVNFFKTRNLCNNCGAANHQIQDCKAGACRVCNKRGHHTSICRERYLPTKEVKPHKEEKEAVNKSKSSTKQADASKENKSKTSKVHAIEINETYEESDIDQTSEEESGSPILAGQLEVSNPIGGKKETVAVILDTASERSFIANELAERLQLQDIDRVKLTIHAFDAKPNKKECGVTKIKLQDLYGEEHEIVVTRIETISRPLERYDLTRKDRNFIKHHNIKLSIDPDSSIIKPQLLLGCEDSFKLLDDRSTTNKTLPSGKKLIASKLGYLVTGGNGNVKNLSDDNTDHADGGTQTIFNEAKQNFLPKDSVTLPRDVAENDECKVMSIVNEKQEQLGTTLQHQMETAQRAAKVLLEDDAEVGRTLAEGEATWSTITPYAPWQGAFHERLIKSIKHSLDKVLQKSTPTMEQLHALLVESKGALNTRQLTNLEDQPDDFVIQRPMEFIQHDMIITYPFETSEHQELDKEYVPKETEGTLRTAKVKQALKFSLEPTKHQSIWSRHYLTNIRETHKRDVSNKRATASIPSEEKVALTQDPIQPRNAWKKRKKKQLAKLKQGKERSIRKTEIRLTNKRTIRRQMIALILLEPEENDENKPTNDEHKTLNDEKLAKAMTPTNVQRTEQEQQQRYDLRPRNRMRTGNSPKHRGRATDDSPTRCGNSFSDAGV